MENKINIAELLKDCPSGMELDCMMYENLYFDKVDEDCIYPIGCYTIYDGIRTSVNFTKYGTFNAHGNAKCIIFPKGKTIWEGFVPPCKFKDGDILFVEATYKWIFIYKENEDKKTLCSYAVIKSDYIYNLTFYDGEYPICNKKDVSKIRFATEEEKQKLFDAIKANGYKWNDETKTLEKLIEPKFKIGDKIRHKSGRCNCCTIKSIENDSYVFEEIWSCMPFNEQHHYELVPNKFDITTLKPFAEVLVRGDVGQKWTHDFFGFMDKEKGCPFVCVGHYVIQCVPFENNEHLLGKTDDCNDFYKTW